MFTAIAQADSAQRYAAAQAKHMREHRRLRRRQLGFLAVTGLDWFYDSQRWPWNAGELISEIKRLSRSINLFDQAAAVLNMAPSARLATMNAIGFQR